LIEYRAEKNAASLDGLQALTPPNEASAIST
jgi:hypothetical protein